MLLLYWNFHFHSFSNHYSNQPSPTAFLTYKNLQRATFFIAWIVNSGILKVLKNEVWECNEVVDLFSLEKLDVHSSNQSIYQTVYASSITICFQIPSNIFPFDYTSYCLAYLNLHEPMKIKRFIFTNRALNSRPPTVHLFAYNLNSLKGILDLDNLRLKRR